MRRSVSIALVATSLGLSAPAHAAGVTIENFSSMAEFQASAVYAYIYGSPGGLDARKARGVQSVKQGTSDVPAASAGAPGNEVVTSEVLAAAMNVPDVFSLSEDPTFYDKRFVSLGKVSSGQAPYMTLEIAPANSGAPGGYNGYDVAVFDLGKNLASGTGQHNREDTVFQVELMSLGTVYDVGTVSATGGNFINVILLDITGIPNIPTTIDAVRLTDVSSESGSIDVDGAITLNLEQSTPAAASSWGALKLQFRE